MKDSGAAGTCDGWCVPASCVRLVASDSYDSEDCSPPGSAACGIFQARTLEWAAASSSEGSFRAKNVALVSCISCAGQ